MDFITNLFSPFNAVDFNLVFQLLCVAAVMLSGPIVIFILALRGGDL